MLDIWRNKEPSSYLQRLKFKCAEVFPWPRLLVCAVGHHQLSSSSSMLWVWARSHWLQTSRLSMCKEGSPGKTSQLHSHALDTVWLVNGTSSECWLHRALLCRGNLSAHISWQRIGFLTSWGGLLQGTSWGSLLSKQLRASVPPSELWHPPPGGLINSSLSSQLANIFSYKFKCPLFYGIVVFLCQTQSSITLY